MKITTGEKTKRNHEGQFVVKLPFSENATSLGDSFLQATHFYTTDLLEMKFSQIPSIYQRAPRFATHEEDAGLRNPHRIQQFSTRLVTASWRNQAPPPNFV